MMSCLLLWLVILPMIGAVSLLLLPKLLTRSIGLATALGGFALSLCLWHFYDPTHVNDFQLAFVRPWILSYHIFFGLGVDGLSFPLILLTKFLVPIALLASWKESRHTKAHFACYLFLDSAMTGTFLATDIFSFYVFWEAMLIPMLLLIGVWGSGERIYAALKFFLFTFVGSLLMLAAIFWLFNETPHQLGGYTGEILSLYQIKFPSLAVERLVFFGFFIAFAIKVPLFPLHTWLPDAHVQAPTGGSILLAGVLLKMGTYGLIRFAVPLCPNAFQELVPYIAILSIIGIIYGAWVAFQQTDMKKLVAYSSVSHLGFVVLGICAWNRVGVTGAVFQMVNHGLTTGALFFLVGVLYERRHSRNFSDYGGLAAILPWFSIVLGFVTCASMAVPGLNGFVGEFLSLSGAFQRERWWGVLGVTGVVFGAAYMLIFLRNTLFGTTHSSENRTLKDLSIREWCGLAPMMVLMIYLGLSPQPFLDKFQPSVEQSLKISSSPKTGVLK